MELTIEWHHDCINSQAQTDAIDIRRGQRKEIICGFCGEVGITVQANRR